MKNFGLISLAYLVNKDIDEGRTDVIEQAKVGDVVTAKGVVRVDKDFGAGYVYKALVEDAVLQR